MTYKFYDRDGSRQVITGMRQLRDRNGGVIPASRLAAAADLLGIPQRTLGRWIAADARRLGRPPGRFELTDLERAWYYRHNCSSSGLYGYLQETRGDERPSRRTVQAAIARLPREEVIYAKLGETGQRLGVGVSIRRMVAHRNERWNIDHFEFPLWVWAPRGKRVVAPWGTIPQDEATLVVPALLPSPKEPDSTAVALALAMGMAPHPRGLNPFRGVPHEVGSDIGTEFGSRHIRHGLINVGSHRIPLGPYRPWEDGKVERLIGTLKRRYCPLARGYKHGPRNPDGSLKSYDPRAFMLWEEFEAWLEQVLDDYHHTVHESLGKTPWQAWEDDETAIVEAGDVSQVLQKLTQADLHRINTDGIRKFKKHFIAPELMTRQGDIVLVRSLPGYTKAVLVYEKDTDTFICEAPAQEDMAPDERKTWQDTCVSARNRRLRAAAKRVDNLVERVVAEYPEIADKAGLALEARHTKARKRQRADARDNADSDALAYPSATGAVRRIDR